MDYMEEKENSNQANPQMDKKGMKENGRNGKKETEKRDVRATVRSSARHRDPSSARREDMSLFDTFDRFLDDRTWVDVLDVFRFPRMLSRFDRAFFPRVNVTETENEVKVIADIPGIDPDAVDVAVRGNRMRLRGSVEHEFEPAEDERERPHRFERMYGSFHREFSLPARVKEDEVRATYKDGVLTIIAPKAEEEKHKKITIEKQ